MATVRGGAQVNRSGYHNQRDLEKKARPSFARDELSNAYAGDENAENRESDGDENGHSTNVKGRKTEKSKNRIPER